MRITTAFVAGVACIGALLAALPAQAKSQDKEDASAEKSSEAKEDTSADKASADKASDAEEDPDSNKAAQAVRARANATMNPQAAGDLTSGKGTIGALIGYGFKDGVGLGFGARGGYTMPFNVYLGATFLYHLGKSEGGASTSLYYFGVEGGYDIAVSPIVIRPYLGVGRVAVTAKIPDDPTLGITGTTATNGYVGFWPGAAAFYTMGHFMAGLDARYLIVKDANAFTLSATAGALF